MMLDLMDLTLENHRINHQVRKNRVREKEGEVCFAFWLRLFLFLARLARKDVIQLELIYR